MSSLYMCVTHNHDLSLVGLAALICALGVCSAFGLGQEALRTEDVRSRIAWTAAAVFATASAIWATHFIGMLAFVPGLPVHFAIARTLVSFGVAVGLVATAAAPLLGRPGWVGRILGGSVVGLAIVAMHYVGMSAYEVQGRLVWDRPAVVASVLLGVGLAALSALLPLSSNRAVRRLAPLSLLAAVCLAHFTGMSAVTIVYDPTIVAPSDGNAFVLTVIVANVALLIVAFSLSAVWLATRERSRREAAERRLYDLADIAVEGLLICEGTRIGGVNQSLERMLGVSRDKLIGRSIRSLLPGITVGAVPDNQEIDADLAAWSGSIPVKLISKLIVAGGRGRTVLAVRDQRDRLRTEAEMVRLAHHDALTGLSNRLRFNEVLAARCSSRQKSETAFALFMLDLDRFKVVNDTLGHGVGDEVLRRVAARLSRVLPDDDLLARLGGDEFAIVASHADNLVDMQSLAEQIIDIITRPFIIDGQVIEIGTSIGIAVSPVDGSTPAQLSHHADLALYRAKEEGRMKFRFFESDMKARMLARRTLEMGLRRAIARQEFDVVYQPQVAARSGAFVGAEALVRWKRPDGRMVSPADFIPFAEDVGLIGAIGDFVLRAACTEATAWPSHLSVAVNISPVQLRDKGFAASVAGILAETGLPGTRLELEITENALLQDDGQTIAVLSALRALGIRMAVDDFGSGYSSLNYLRRFPFDKIKIDQSFVRPLPGDTDSTAIFQAIAALGNKLSMTVTAEGVETPEQQRFSAAEGCDQLQGYLISRPISAEGIAALFAAKPGLSTIAA